MTKMIIALCTLALLAGCAGSNMTPIDANAVYAGYIGQQRDYPSFTLDSGSNGVASITLSGGASMRVRHDLPALSARSRDPSVASQIVTAGASVAKVAAAGYFGTELIKAMPSQQAPVIVEQPAPIIIQPTP